MLRTSYIFAAALAVVSAVAQWTPLAPLPYSASWHRGTVLHVPSGGALPFPAGHVVTSGGSGANSTAAYSFLAQSWSWAAPRPGTFTQGSLSRIDNTKAIAIGCRANGFPLNLEFDAFTNTWTVLTASAFDHTYCGSIRFGGHLYVFDPNAGASEKLNLLTRTWSPIGPTPLHGFATAAVLGCYGKIYVSCASGFLGLTTFIYEYSPATDTWNYTPIFVGTLGAATTNMVFGSDNMIYLADSTNLYSVNPSNGQLTTLPSAPSGHSSGSTLMRLHNRLELHGSGADRSQYGPIPAPGCPSGVLGSSTAVNWVTARAQFGHPVLRCYRPSTNSFSRIPVEISASGEFLIPGGLPEDASRIHVRFGPFLSRIEFVDSIGGTLDFHLIAGDCDQDDRVSIRDLVMILRSYGSSLGAPGYNPMADLDQDGSVSSADLSIFKLGFARVGDEAVF